VDQDSLGELINIIPQGLCTQYTNGVADLGEFDESLRYNMFNLSLPLQVIRRGERLTYGLSLRATVPMTSRIRQFQLGQDQVFESDQIICTYYLEENSVHGRINLQDFQWSLGALVNYHLGERFAVGLSVERWMSNLFNAQSTNPEFRHFGFSFQPIRVQMVGTYYLN
jgi:hypothetical protein